MTNTRRAAALAGTVCPVVLAALLVAVTTDLSAQDKTPRAAKPVMTPIARLSPRPAVAMPDLVVASITAAGAPTPVGSNVEVPVLVVVRNQGTAAAGAFKVSAHFVKPGGGELAVAFSVPGAPDIWYPRSSGLSAGASITFRGKLAFLSSVHGAVTATALADSCSGEEFTESYCHVKESNEANNRSTPLALTLP